MASDAVSDAMSIFCGVANFRLRDVGGESFVDVDILCVYRIDKIPAVPRGLNMVCVCVCGCGAPGRLAYKHSGEIFGVISWGGWMESKQYVGWVSGVMGRARCPMPYSYTRRYARKT